MGDTNGQIYREMERESLDYNEIIQQRKVSVRQEREEVKCKDSL